MDESIDRRDEKSRFVSLDAAKELAKKGHHIKLPKDVDEFVRAIPPGERSVWMRKVLSDAARKAMERNT